jgi:probable HAF family extracellular repeat protein
MPSTSWTTVGHRLGGLVAGVVVVATLTAGTAEAATPAPMAGPTVGLMGLAVGDPGGGLGAGLRERTGASASPRTPVPGFLLDRGRYTRFDAPGAHLETAPTGIDNRGQIVGNYLEDDADATYHGFLRDARGRFTNIDLPGAKATVTSRINDHGQIVGRYYQTAPFRGPDARFRGFLLDRGKLTRIDVPGATQTQAVGVNNLGQVVGEYQNPDGTYHGFLWRKGHLTTIDLPGAAATSLVDINDRGQILGIHVDRAGQSHGLLLDRGRFTTIDAPSRAFTFVRDINNRGQIAGYALDDPVTLAGARGFLLAKGARGPFTPIDVPGAPRNLVYGINDRNQLVGSYENINATPSLQPTGTPPMGRMA